MPQYQGIWTLAQAAQLQSTQRWATDPLFENTTLLLQADNAANGAQNNTFLDSSSNNFTITRNGNTTQGTFTPFSQSPGWWGNYFDGTGDNLSLASVTAVGNSNATVEFFIYPTDSSLTYRSVFDSRSSTNTDTGFGIFQYGAGIEVYGNGLKVASTTGALNINQWNHVALTRSSGTCQVYVNGIASGSSATYSSNLTSTIAKIGDSVNTAFPYIGYISNLRVVIGSVLYSGATYTVPTASLTAITNTSLLTCQSNRFVDNSTNAFAITVNGDTSVQAFSPFAPQYQYTPSVTGGSGYFDGTGDYLTAPNINFASNDFCVECWFYWTSNDPTSYSALFGKGTGDSTEDFTLLFKNTEFYFDWGGSGSAYAQRSATINRYQWNHVALARSSGVIKIFLNGVQQGADISVATISNNYTTWAIGAVRNAGIVFTGGYISSVRFVNGSPVYTTTFTPPTAPLTAITNTALLLNFTNAGIYDGTLKNNLETVGNAQVSTSVVKYGTGSMYFDGTGDYLKAPVSPVEAMGTGDFTAECWVYRTASGQRTFFDTRTANDAAGFLVQSDSSNYLAMFTNGAFQITDSSSTLPLNEWVHVALVRSSGSTKLYKNGTQVGSTYSDSNNYSAGRVIVGSNFGLTTYMQGYIDDLRITKGIARYTANFTPPRVALPRQ